jgi:hypothetical protein
MASPLKVFVIFLLLLNGTGAIFGGAQLMVHPDGSTMDLPLSLLTNSPFHNYFIPGMVLFFANGLFSFFVISAIIMELKNCMRYIIAQGIILTIWILAQVFLIRMVTPLHILLGSTGVLLVLCGVLLTMLGRVEANNEEQLSIRRK